MHDVYLHGNWREEKWISEIRALCKMLLFCSQRTVRLALNSFIVASFLPKCFDLFHKFIGAQREATKKSKIKTGHMEILHQEDFIRLFISPSILLSPDCHLQNSCLVKVGAVEFNETFNIY